MLDWQVAWHVLFVLTKSERKQLFVHCWCFARIQSFAVSIVLVSLVLVRFFLSASVLLWGFSKAVPMEKWLLHWHLHAMLMEIQRNVRPLLGWYFVAAVAAIARWLLLLQADFLNVDDDGDDKKIQHTKAPSR